MNVIFRFFARQAIVIRDSQVVIVKGKLPRSTLIETASACRMNGIQSGEIWISPNGKVSFSSQIPKTAQQQLRNAIRGIG